MAQSSGTEGHSGGGTDRGRCPAWSRWNVRARNLVVRCAGQLAYGTSSQGERSDRPVGYRRSSAAAHGGWGGPSERTAWIDDARAPVARRKQELHRCGAPRLGDRLRIDRPRRQGGLKHRRQRAWQRDARVVPEPRSPVARPRPAGDRSCCSSSTAQTTPTLPAGGQAPIVHMQGESRAAVLSTERHADHASSTRGGIGKLLTEELCRAA
jgi:hypothetical protein